MGYVRGGYTLRRTLIFVHHTGHSNLAYTMLVGVNACHYRPEFVQYQVK